MQSKYFLFSGNLNPPFEVSELTQEEESNAETGRFDYMLDITNPFIAQPLSGSPDCTIA